MKPTQIATARPCAHCPFRRDLQPFLHPERVREIFAAAKSGQHFVCHETVDYSCASDQPDLGRLACAGFLILARRAGLFPGLQFVQLAERLAAIDFHTLRGEALVYRSIGEMVERHEASA